MGSKRENLFLSELCLELFRQHDSFDMAKCFGRSVLRHSKLQGARLIWPDSSLAPEPLRTETLGKLKSENSKPVYSARFRDQGELFFRIDFYGSPKTKLSPSWKQILRSGLRLVSKAIAENEQRGLQEELSRFHWMRQLSAGLSHELNTPLTTLLFHAKKLARGNPESLASAQIQAASDTIGKVLQQYQVLSGDGQFIESREVPLLEIYTEIQNEARTAFPEARKWLVFRQDSNSGAVSGQIRDLSRMCLMLIQNSIDAIAERRKINPAFEPWIELHFRTKGNALQILITDNGQGIKAENRRYIFAPFFSTKDVNQGSGLGLSLARSIAFLNDGSLNLNPLSERTQFILELPLVTSPKSVRKKAA